MIDLELAKNNVDMLGTFKSDPHKLYTELEAEGITLSQRLETIDPSEVNPETGKPIDGIDALSRSLMSAEVYLDGPKQISLEKLVAKSLVLLPELVAREIKAGMNSTPRCDYTSLVAVRNEVSGPSYHPAYIPEMNLTSPQSTIGKNAKSLGRRTAAGQGGMFPVTSLRYREKDVKVRDYGRQFEVSYKLLRAMPWQEFAVFLRLVGVQLSNDKLFDIYDLGITGDGTTGAATDVFNGTAGSLTYTDLVHAYMQLDCSYEMNAMLCPVTSLETVLTMAQFQDPQAGFEFQKTGKLVTPIGSELKQINTAPSGAPTGTKIVFLDKRFAVRETSAQPLMVESKKIIELKFEEAVVSEESVFTVLADGAIKQIVWT